MSSTWAHTLVDDLVEAGRITKRKAQRLRRYFIEDPDGYLVTQGAFNALLARLKAAEVRSTSPEYRALPSPEEVREHARRHGAPGGAWGYWFFKDSFGLHLRKVRVTNIGRPEVEKHNGWWALVLTDWVKAAPAAFDGTPVPWPDVSGGGE